MAPRDAVPVTQLYQKQEIVGKGSYGAVYKGVEVATGKIVALKIINLDTEDDDVGDIQREVTLLSQLRGAERNNVSVYYGCYLEGPRVWIIMDFASGGSVRTLMKATKKNIIEERFAVVIVRECLVALTFLHKSGVIHRDMKAANILITHTGRVVLCDFGVSALLTTSQSKRTTFVGTPHWMAPEVITSGSLYDAKADIWSLGVTIYEMITGGPPHADQLNLRAIALIPKSKPPRLPDNAGSKEMKEFVSFCLRELPAERPSAEELSKLKWIKSSSKVPVSFLRELLTIYDNWARQGGVRASLAGDVDWENESNGDPRNSGNWEFDTVRGVRHPGLHVNGNGDFRYDSDEYLLPSSNTTLAYNTTQRAPSPALPLVAHAPRSLRLLFEDGNAMLQTPDSTGVSRSPSPSFLRNPNLRDPATEGPDAPTPRQGAWAQSPSTSSSGSQHLLSTPPDSPPKTASYRDVRATRGLPNISIPSVSAIPSSSFLHSDHDEDIERPTFSSSPESDKEHFVSPAFRLPLANVPPVPREESDPPTTPPRPAQGVSPTPITFPSAGPPSPSLSPSSSLSPPQRLPPLPGVPNGSPARHLATTPAHPRAARALTTNLSEVSSSATGSNSLIKPATSPTRTRPPGITRLASVAVMETPSENKPNEKVTNADPVQTIKPGAGRLAPFRGGYRSEPEGSGSSLTIRPPKPSPSVGLKDVLNLSPMPNDVTVTALGGIDLLPPSPSTVLSLAGRPQPFSHSPQPELSPSRFDPASPQVPASGTGLIANSRAAPPEIGRSAVAFGISAADSAGPPIRPLDYSLMMSSDLHIELTRTVDDLGQWLGLVESGLARLLQAVASDPDDDIEREPWSEDGGGVVGIPEENEASSDPPDRYHLGHETDE